MTFRSIPLLVVVSILSSVGLTAKAHDATTSLPEAIVPADLDDNSAKAILRLFISPEERELFDTILDKKSIQELNDDEKAMLDELINRGVYLLQQSQNPIF